ncbi:MAG: SLC13 family permease [Hyphomicrobiaceae bacterium]|nr:SLC13 family permease [Hyphomicrobiaceae bacterium]
MSAFAEFAVLAIVAAAILAYVSERWSIEVISVAILAALLFLFSLPESLVGSAIQPSDLLQGFANPALLAVLSLLVLGQGMFRTDALAPITASALKLSRTSPRGTFVGLLIFVAIVSAFVNNTPIVVMFLPLVTALATRYGVAPSKVLMPFSFAAILGGMTTLIGSSTNLLAAGVAAPIIGRPIGLFEITLFGGIVALAGLVYVIAILPLILPKRTTLSGSSGISGKQFIAEILLLPGHPLLGATAKAGLFPALKDITVRSIKRKGAVILPPFDAVTLSVGDRVILAGTRDAIARALVVDAAAQSTTGSGTLVLTELVVAPASRFVSREVTEADASLGEGANVIAIERRSRMPRGSMAELRLEPGDVLLVAGTEKAVQGLRSNRELLVLDLSTSELPDPTKASIARLIFLLTVLAAGFDVVPIVVAAFIGAFLMIASGCLNFRQAARAIDTRIMMLVAAAIAMASALQATGGTSLIAQFLADLGADLGPMAVLSGLFLIVAVLTNILSNNATAVLFTPIAIELARIFGVDPFPFVTCIILASNCSFATPIGYQTNLIVMGPGHYRFSDFLIGGLPLVVLCWAVFSLAAPWYYGL